MTIRRPYLIILLSPLALMLSACKTFDQGSDQAVVVQSYPAGATVYMDGESLGETPVTLELARKLSHRVIIEKAGYKTIDATIAPVENQAGQSTVRFGLLDDAGYYYDLDPNPVQIQLTPDVIPATRGPDAYGEMTAIIADVDAKRLNGEITPAEHKYMVEKVVEFYSN